MVEVMVSLLDEMVRREASDLHLTSGAPSFLRVEGRFYALPEVSSEELAAWLDARGDVRTRLQEVRTGVDFALTHAGRRLRGNAYLVRGGMALTLRLLPARIPTLAEIGAPPGFCSLAQARHGLILVTGRVGSGKTTSLASLLMALTAAAADSERRGLHVITLEDPIEYLCEASGSLIHQRELGRDFLSFSEALRSALREDPDVLLVTELRDVAAVRAALAAAEAGMLVLSTLHARTAAEAVQRLADFFPAEERVAARAALAAAVTAIAAQRLVAGTSGRQAVFEVLLRTPAICRMIHDGEERQIPSAMLAGRREGMTTFAAEGRRLLQAGKLTRCGYEALMEEVRDGGIHLSGASP